MQLAEVICICIPMSNSMKIYTSYLLMPLENPKQLYQAFVVFLTFTTMTILQMTECF